MREVGLRRNEAQISISTLAEVDAEAWDDLVRRAGAAHPYYSRHVMAAHAAAGLLPQDVRILTIGTGRIEALLPFRLQRDISGLGGLVGRPFLSVYMTSSAPLLARDAPLGTAVALAEGLRLASGGRAWRWPHLSTDGPAASTLLAALAAEGWRTGTVSSFERPILERRANHEAYLKDHPHRSRFKDLRRRMRRLGEMGELTIESATEGERLAALANSFLILEQAGWKGEAGTAMAARTGTEALARDLFVPEVGPVGARADALRLDGRVVAVSLALTGGGVATLLKTAFDETLRGQAPGLLLEAEIVRLCHETRFADRLDSATLAGSALESLYRERETVSELIAVPPGGDRLSLERRVRLARFEQSSREIAKRLLRPNGR